MCGFAGWIDWNKNLTRYGPVLETMGKTLAARGPDESGSWLSPHGAFAHRRLVVIDPAGGKQPMVRQFRGRTCVMVYNGELYNTGEIRNHLKTLGHVFLSHSDTEVLLAAFMEWGPQCVKRLNGIFAFGVWDPDRKELFLARDHLGVKPLFYRHAGGSFLFASELKALLAHPEVQPQVDAEGLAELFALGPARTPGVGVFKGIEELKPGHTLFLNQHKITVSRYWSLVSRPHEDSLEDTAATIRALFEDAVRRQLVSDVPISTLLSGGLDSSAITAFAAGVYAQTAGQPIDTYSVDYVGNQRFFRPNSFQPGEDAPWVKKMSDFLGTVHHYVYLETSRLTESLEAAVSARDLPGMADIDSSLYLFSREIKKEATVAISGECADEIFGGYPWFSRKEALEADTFPWSLKVDQRFSLLSPELKAYIRPEEYLHRRYREALEEVPRLPGEEPLQARIREIFYLTLTRWMPVLLDRKDRMSMAAGLEIRVPYCDHRLVEYLWNVPWSMKTYNNMEKGIFRKALEGSLPLDVLYRKKSPYPKTHDPGFLEAAQEKVLESISNPASPLRSLLNKEEINRLASQDSDFDIPWFGQLMRLPQLFAYLVQLDMWFEKYKVSIV